MFFRQYLKFDIVLPGTFILLFKSCFEQRDHISFHLQKNVNFTFMTTAENLLHKWQLYIHDTWIYYL